VRISRGAAERRRHPHARSRYRYPSRNAAPHLIEIIAHLHLQRSDAACEARDRLWAELDAFFENVET
jgi:hypothetical protein